MTRRIHLLLLLVWASHLPAARPPLPPPLPRVVEIARVETPGWGALAPLPGDFLLNRAVPEARPGQDTRVRMAWNDEALRVHFHCDEENMAGLITYHSGSAIWQNDCVELFLDVSLERRNILQVICSADGQKQVYAHGFLLQPGEIAVQVRHAARHWEAELTLPWKLFGSRPELFRAALSRERWAGATEFSTWNWPNGFNAPDCHGYFFAGDQTAIMRKLLHDKTTDHEYLAVIQQQAPAGAAAWKTWMQTGHELLRLPPEPHSAAVVAWLDSQYQLELQYPRHNTLYNARIAELLSRP